ncbi:hypothetical protein ILYODFUR_018037, partial [Ilyodon furcidens]
GAANQESRVNQALFLFFQGLTENGGGVQRSGRDWRHRTRGGLPQYDCLQKNPYSFFCVSFQAALQCFNNLPIPSVKGLGSEGSLHCQG